MYFHLRARPVIEELPGHAADEPGDEQVDQPAVASLAGIAKDRLRPGAGVERVEKEGEAKEHRRGKVLRRVEARHDQHRRARGHGEPAERAEADAVAAAPPAPAGARRSRRLDTRSPVSKIAGQIVANDHAYPK